MFPWYVIEFCKSMKNDGLLVKIKSVNNIDTVRHASFVNAINVNTSNNEASDE